MRFLAAAGASMIGAALLFGCSPSREVTPWVKQYGEYQRQSVRSIAVGQNGEVALTGKFEQEINFGGGSLFSAGGTDIFVALLDETGTTRWSGRTGDRADEWGQAIAVAPNGDVVLAGNFSQKITFGTTSLIADRPSAFLTRFDPGGTPLWVQKLGGDSAYLAQLGGLALTPEGDIVIGGAFEGTANFDGDPVFSDDMTSFVVKFDANGNSVFHVAFGGRQNLLSALTVDPAGAILVAGVTTGVVKLGGGSFTSASDGASFVAKINANGTPAWLAQLGRGISEPYGFSLPLVGGIASDPDGNVLVSGVFDHSMAFGDQTLHANGSRDAFIVNMSPTGAPIWIAQIGNTDTVLSPPAITTDLAGHVLVTGSYVGSLDLGGGELHSQDVPRVYFAELDEASAHVVGSAFPGGKKPGTSDGTAIAFDPAGGVVWGGTFSDDLRIDQVTMTSESDGDIFLVREKR